MDEVAIEGELLTHLTNIGAMFSEGDGLDTD